MHTCLEKICFPFREFLLWLRGGKNANKREKFDVLWGWGRRGRMFLTVDFLGTWVGSVATPPRRLYLEVLGDPVKNGNATDSYTQQFSRGF